MGKMFKKVMIALIVGITAQQSFAKSTIEQTGDWFEVIIPAYAFGLAMKERDYAGAKQFAYSFAATQTTVNGLKLAIKEPRPSGGDNRSFPSGHTASAFSGAAFIHKRYGLRQAVVPYLMAGFTGYSRIHADRHYFHDVAAGAAISILFTWIFVDEESNFQLSAGPESVKLGFNAEF
jgi:membrane-associated phospholipid phosphatase